MVIGENMTIQNYLMINESTNVVDNICEWDGNLDTWQPPANTLMLVQTTTPAMVWVLNQDQTDYVLTEMIGQGQIGFTWNGTVCTTNQPKPAIPVQPTTQGTQTL
jgi:hypothetical protein